MSFRYTNYMTGLFKQRLLLNRALQTVAQRKYTGRCAGVEVTTSAYGRLLDLRVDDTAQTAYVNESTGVVQSEQLAQAIRGALFDANTKLRRDKEEAYRESIRGAPQLVENDHVRNTVWNEHDGGSLPPRVYEALRDEPMIEAKSSSTTKSADQHADGGSIFGQIRAKHSDSMAASMPELAGALLQLEDPALVAEKQRVRMDDAESAFWQRVDLIRRAQLNVIGPEKRRYEEFETSSAANNDFEERMKMKFAK